MPAWPNKLGRFLSFFPPLQERTVMKHGCFQFTAIVALLCISPAVHAQLPVTQLTSVFPPGAKEGTSADVTLAGTDLDEVGQLVFNHPGITASPIMAAATKLEPERPLPGQFKVNVGSDVAPGVYEARAQGRFGLSNPRSFTV